MTSQEKEPLFRTTPKGIILCLKQKTDQDQPMGVWFSKLTAKSGEFQFVKIQLTYLQKKGDENERVFVEPATLCSLNAFEILLVELSKMKRE
jgi:hypothetical protein